MRIGILKPQCDCSGGHAYTLLLHSLDIGLLKPFSCYNGKPWQSLHPYILPDFTVKITLHAALFFMVRDTMMERVRLPCSSLRSVGSQWYLSCEGSGTVSWISITAWLVNSWQTGTPESGHHFAIRFSISLDHSAQKPQVWIQPEYFLCKWL